MAVAVLVILGTLIAPAHAASMAIADIAPTEHRAAAPCPMTGMAAMDHAGDEGDDADTHASMMRGMACCGAQILGSGDRPALPIRSAASTMVDAPYAVLSALANPTVDIQPPRG